MDVLRVERQNQRLEQTSVVERTRQFVLFPWLQRMVGLPFIVLKTSVSSPATLDVGAGTRPIRKTHQLSRLSRYILPKETTREIAGKKVPTQHRDLVSPDGLAKPLIQQPPEMINPPGGWAKGRPWTPIGYHPQPGPAFHGVPNPNDVAQGPIGDCWILAALCAYAAFTPGALERMIRKIDERTYGVTLTPPGESSPREYIVDTDMPKVQTSRTNIIGTHARMQNGVIWPLLIEKAFAAMMTEGYEAIGHGEMPSKAVDALGADQAFEMLTKTYSVEFFESLIEYVSTMKIPMVVAVRVTSENSALAKEKEVGDVGLAHALWLKSYDPVTKLVHLGNPWGSWADPKPLTLDELRNLMMYVSIGNIWTPSGKTIPSDREQVNHLVSRYRAGALQILLRDVTKKHVPALVGLQLTSEHATLAAAKGLSQGGVIQQLQLTWFNPITMKVTLTTLDPIAPQTVELTLAEFKKLAVVISTPKTHNADTTLPAEITPELRVAKMDRLVVLGSSVKSPGRN